MYDEKRGKNVVAFQVLSLERSSSGSPSARLGSESFRCCHISWRHCGVMLPVRWAWSSTLGRESVNAASTSVVADCVMLDMNLSC